MFIFCVHFNTIFVLALNASLEEIERHLEMGKQFLAKGQFADSLTHYHAAVGPLQC